MRDNLVFPLVADKTLGELMDEAERYPPALRRTPNTSEIEFGKLLMRHRGLTQMTLSTHYNGMKKTVIILRKCGQFTRIEYETHHL